MRGWYVDDLVDNWPSPVKGSWDVPTAVEVYRQVLAEAEDHSVVISAIGFATNLADLLRSGPDDKSPLTGAELVGQKVKTVVWQGGWYLCTVHSYAPPMQAGILRCTASVPRPTTGTAAGASMTPAGATGSPSTP